MLFDVSEEILESMHRLTDSIKLIDKKEVMYRPVGGSKFHLCLFVLRGEKGHGHLENDRMTAFGQKAPGQKRVSPPTTFSHINNYTPL